MFTMLLITAMMAAEPHYAVVLVNQPEASVKITAEQCKAAGLTFQAEDKGWNGKVTGMYFYSWNGERWTEVTDFRTQTAIVDRMSGWDPVDAKRVITDQMILEYWRRDGGLGGVHGSWVRAARRLAYLEYRRTGKIPESIRFPRTTLAPAQ